MPRYLKIYHGAGMPEIPEEGAKAMAAWDAWYQSMGGANPVSGYTIVESNNYAIACKHAAGNPMVVDGSGSVEVADFNDMGYQALSGT